MSGTLSYSELFQAGTKLQSSPLPGLTENGPDINGKGEGPLDSSMDTKKGVPERPRHVAIIPGYEDERIKERKILTLRDLLYIFFKHLRSITTVTAVCFVTAGLYAFSVTPLYKADTKLLIRLGREKLSDVNEYSRNVNLFYQERNQDVNNELEVFKSDELSRMVYEDLKDRFDQEEAARKKKGGLGLLLSRMKAGLTGSKLTREDKIILSLKESLKIEFLAETDILRLSYKSPDPEFAALAANTYANAFIRLRTKIYETKKSHVFYIDQIALYKKKVDDLVEEEKTFARKWQISGIDKEKELILQHRENLEAESLKARQEYDRSTALLASVQKMYNTPGDWIETPKMTENEMVDRQGYLQDIDRQYFTLKLERSRLSSQFTDKSREIQQLDSSITQLRKQKYLSLVNILELTRTAMAPSIKELAAEIERKNKRINELIQAAFVLEQLKVKKDVAVGTFLSYTKKAEDLRIYDDLDKKQITSLNTINTAMAPLEPDFPKKGLILMTATFFGVFLSFGLSAVKEFFTHVFRDGQDIERILKIPLLMSIGYREK
jgi:polysaccharide biosynthesis protein PslE